MLLTDQRRFKRNLLRTISRRSDVASGGSEIAQDLLATEIERFLTSRGVHFATLHKVWSSKLGSLEATLRWEAAVRHGRGQPYYGELQSARVPWYYKARSTAGFRKICMFEPEQQMWHSLAKDLIVARYRPRAHIGDWRERGRDHQIKQLLAAITTSSQVAVVADVKRAFESVNFDAVYELRLVPDELVRRAIDARTHTFRHIDRSERDLPPEARLSTMTNHGDDEVVPSGLMEGMSASNAIFSVLLDDLPDHVDEHVLVFAYCDNIILLAPSLLQAQRAQSALVEYLTGHRAGPFDLRSEIHSVRDGFDHLGYHIRLEEDGHLHVGLSMKNWEKLVAELDETSGDVSTVSDWLARSFPYCCAEALRSYVTMMINEALARGRLAGWHFKTEEAANQWLREKLSM